MPSSCSAGWPDLHAKWANAWTLAVARLPLSGLEARVLMYVVARTWGDYDGRRQRFGKSSERLSSADIAEALGLNSGRSVRKAIDHLIKLGALRRFKKHAGRAPAAIGPDRLLAARLPAGVAGCEPQISMDDALEGLSPEMRRAAERSMKCEA